MTASPLRTPLRQCQDPSMIPSKAVSGEVPLIELKPRITPPFMPHLARPIANHLRRLGRVNTSHRSCCRRRRDPRLCRPDLARQDTSQQGGIDPRSRNNAVRARGEGNRRCDAEDGGAAERRGGLEGRGEAPRHEGEQVVRDGRRGRGLAAEQRLLLRDEGAGCGVRLAVGGSGGAGDALRLRLSDACVVEWRAAQRRCKEVVHKRVVRAICELFSAWVRFGIRGGVLREHLAADKEVGRVGVAGLVHVHDAEVTHCGALSTDTGT
ncbi:uncharacterized protein K441DRAFT_676255 [Cenococcum geophilum 1.58]|uniref:uncharacterized protein n=1 Tax=Cenococcum geophilum 1.58 TaxID=794803 RepID=UPI00358E61E6|nr:hypothetical protein K441DRAFT_676255 [Cenococcum geophilum 1.58]